MKKYFLVFLLTTVLTCCGLQILSAQNLVMNPSFETYSSCPQGISEFSLCTNWSTTTTVASDSCSTPDLYNTCSPQLGGVNVPNALLGTHQPHSGNGFAGIILGDGFVGCVQTGDNYREYIEGQMTTPLTAGQKYLVKFYMSLAEAGMWGSNSVGIYFTNTQYVHDACPNSIINVTPQLEMCGPAIMDTVNWVPVQWIYTAAGGEQFLTLGNFKNDANTNHVTHNCGSFNPYIYYYIDDMSVTPIPAGTTNICGVTVITDSINATCGGQDGSVVATASGCTTPFAFKWNNGATTASLSNLAAGSYSVTVTDASNCLTTASISINSNPLTATLAATNPSCGSNTGTATVTIGSGTGPYTYLWSNGATTSGISSLAPGSYIVSVNGAAGCTAIDSVSLLGASGLTISPAITGASCGTSNGSATAVVTGGSAPYTFKWSNGDTTATITGLTAGSYTVTVAGDTINPPLFSDTFPAGDNLWTLNSPGSGTNGSSANQWVINSDNNCTCGSGNYLHISPTSNGACFICLPQAGQCTYLELASTFGEGDFTTDVLAESPVISTIGKSNLTLSFSYECLGTPGSDYGLVDVSSDGGAHWTALPTQYVNVSTCTQATVSIPINYQNIANFRFAFEWINAAGSFGSAGNPPGFVVDNVVLTAAASSCPAVATVTIPASGGLTVTATPTAPTCGLKNGAVTVTANGTGPFTYAWNNGQTTQTIRNLVGGVYIVTVSTGAGCSATASATLSIGSGTISAVALGTNATCGSSNGAIKLSLTPANASYGYLWSNGATTDSLSNLPAGIYSVTVTAGSVTCSAVATDTIGATGALNISAVGGSAGCTSTGTASVTTPVTGGPFSYLWSNGATTASLTGLSSGSYVVTVTGAGGCSASASATVTNSGTGITLNASTTPTSCSGNTGGVNISITAGSGSYTYLWSNGATTSAITNLGAGSYTVTVTSSNSCSATAEGSVSVSGTLLINTSAIGTTCGNSNGSATVTAAGGPFTYIWSNGATTASIGSLAAGTYTVTVNGASGCNATQSVVVNPSGSTVSITPSATAICQGDTSHICAPSGYHKYLWNIGDTSACINITGPGNYYVTVTDNGNCTAVSNHVAITVNAPPTVTITVHGGDTLVASGAVSYQWYFGSTIIAGATSSVYVVTQDGSYTAIGTDGNGCTARSNAETIKVVLGVAQVITDENIKVYPNPLSNGSWHVEVSNEWIGSICNIIDEAGRVIYRTQLKASQSEIELSIAQGVYLMQINSGQKSYTIKLIKL